MGLQNHSIKKSPPPKEAKLRRRDQFPETISLSLSLSLSLSTFLQKFTDSSLQLGQNREALAGFIAGEICIMSPGDTAPQSPLDKPLHQLTEDDISQLTREDCRRYLKEKGMRRPSWNKSQAIQQVISLKTLLEPTSESEAGDVACARKKLYIPRPEIPQRVTVASSDASEKGTRDSSRISLSAAEETVPYRRQDPPKTDISVDRPDHRHATVAGADVDSVSPRTTAATNGPVGQMTIFYCGKVNVYDDMPCEKAQTIMQIAASPFHFAHESSCDGFAAVGPHSCHLPSPSIKGVPGSPGTVFPASQTEGASSRKASVQRYLEKRKDRFKRKVGMPSSASLDIHLNHRVGDRSPNEQLSRGDACSPYQPRLPHTPARCSSIENVTRNANLSADLNYKDDEDR